MLPKHFCMRLGDAGEDGDGAGDDDVTMKMYLKRSITVRSGL